MAYEYRGVNNSVGKSASIAGLNPELALLALGIGAIFWVLLGLFQIDWSLKLGIIFLFISATMILTAGGIWKFLGQFWKPRRYVSVPIEYKSPLLLLKVGEDDFLNGRSAKQIDPLDPSRRSRKKAVKQKK